MTKLDIYQALKLANKIQTSLPQIQLLDGEKDGHLLCIKADLITQDHLTYLNEVAKENKLSLRLKEGYWMLIGQPI